jgi:hypothetical protein
VATSLWVKVSGKQRVFLPMTRCGRNACAMAVSPATFHRRPLALVQITPVGALGVPR